MGEKALPTSATVEKPLPHRSLSSRSLREEGVGCSVCAEETEKVQIYILVPVIIALNNIHIEIV